MSSIAFNRRRTLASLVVGVALAALTLVSIAAAPESSAMPARATGGNANTPKALAFHDAMRALWEAHGTWTERAIVDFAGELPDTELVVARLLQNQTEIGD